MPSWKRTKINIDWKPKIKLISSIGRSSCSWSKQLSFSAFSSLRSIRPNTRTTHGLIFASSLRFWSFIGSASPRPGTALIWWNTHCAILTSSHIQLPHSFSVSRRSRWCGWLRFVICLRVWIKLSLTRSSPDSLVSHWFSVFQSCWLDPWRHLKLRNL